MGEMEEGVSVEREFENCRGYNWPCEECTAPNCPERKCGYKPTASELEEQMYGRREDYDD